jgi:prolyl-tRNA synthetase
VKFNDADLIGLPVRVVVSPRNLKEGVVEIKARDADDPIKVPQTEATNRIKALLADRGV